MEQFKQEKNNNPVNGDFGPQFGDDKNNQQDLTCDTQQHFGLQEKSKKKKKVQGKPQFCEGCQKYLAYTTYRDHCKNMIDGKLKCSLPNTSKSVSASGSFNQLENPCWCEECGGDRFNPRYFASRQEKTDHIKLRKLNKEELRKREQKEKDKRKQQKNKERAFKQAQVLKRKQQRNEFSQSVFNNLLKDANTLERKLWLAQLKVKGKQGTDSDFKHYCEIKKEYYRAKIVAIKYSKNPGYLLNAVVHHARHWQGLFSLAFACYIKCKYVGGPKVPDDEREAKKEDSTKQSNCFQKYPPGAFRIQNQAAFMRFKTLPDLLIRGKRRRLLLCKLLSCSHFKLDERTKIRYPEWSEFVEGISKFDRLPALHNKLCALCVQNDRILLKSWAFFLSKGFRVRDIVQYERASAYSEGIVQQTLNQLKHKDEQFCEDPTKYKYAIREYKEFLSNRCLGLMQMIVFPEACKWMARNGCKRVATKVTSLLQYQRKHQSGPMSFIFNEPTKISERANKIVKDSQMIAWARMKSYMRTRELLAKAYKENNQKDIDTYETILSNWGKRRKGFGEKEKGEKVPDQNLLYNLRIACLDLEYEGYQKDINYFMRKQKAKDMRIATFEEFGFTENEFLELEEPAQQRAKREREQKEREQMEKSNARVSKLFKTRSDKKKQEYRIFM